MHPTSAAELSEERRAQMEQSIGHLIRSEISRDEISRELSVNDPRNQLVVLDELSLVLNAYRNRLVPINRLPQDIMHHIFSIVLQAEDIHKLQPAVSADYPLKFVDQRGRLRLVSRAWNSFIISMPGFWMLVDTEVTDLAVLSRRIERAQQRELCVVHRSNWFADIEFQELATSFSPHFDRIRTLQLEGGDFAAALLKNPLPALRTLEVWQHSQWFTISQDHFPQLSTLRLSGCYLPHNTRTLSMLRALHLFNSRDTHINAILGFLGFCPELDELTISHYSLDQILSANSHPTAVSFEKLRRLELRDMGTPCLLHVLGSMRTPSLKHVIFPVPIETFDSIEIDLQAILQSLQILNAGFSPAQFRVFNDAIACASEDGRLVEGHPPRCHFSSFQRCADTLLGYLKPGTLRIAVELEYQERFQWLKQVFEGSNVIDLRVRLGSNALQMSRAVGEYLALFDKESDEEIEEESRSTLPLASLQALTFEGGTVDLPQLLRVVASRVARHRVASARIQIITLINCEARQWPNLSSRFHGLGVELVVQ